MNTAFSISSKVQYTRSAFIQIDSKPNVIKIMASECFHCMLVGWICANANSYLFKCVCNFSYDNKKCRSLSVLFIPLTSKECEFLSIFQFSTSHSAGGWTDGRSWFYCEHAQAMVHDNHCIKIYIRAWKAHSMRQLYRIIDCCWISYGRLRLWCRNVLSSSFLSTTALISPPGYRFHQ